MDEPRFGDSGDDFERALVRSARGDKLAPSKREKLLLSLGVGAVAVAAPTAAASAQAAPSVAAGAGASVAPLAPTVGGLATSATKVAGAGLSAKWLAIGLAGVGLTGAGGAWMLESTPAERAPLAALAPTSKPAAPMREVAPGEVPAASEPAPPAALATAPNDASEATASVSPPRRRTQGSAESRNAPSLPSVGEELRSLEAVRATLRKGDARRALLAAERHAAAYPSGAFAEEAEVLRIEALTKAGRTDEASSRALRFVTLHPTSVHAKRVRGFVRSGP